MNFGLVDAIDPAWPGLFLCLSGLPGEALDGYIIRFAKDFTRFLCRLHKNRETIMCIVTKIKFALETCYKMV